MILGGKLSESSSHAFLIYSAIMGLPEDFRSFPLWTLQIYPLLFPLSFLLKLFEIV